MKKASQNKRSVIKKEVIKYLKYWRNNSMITVGNYKLQFIYSLERVVYHCTSALSPVSHTKAQNIPVEWVHFLEYPTNMGRICTQIIGEPCYSLFKNSSLSFWQITDDLIYFMVLKIIFHILKIHTPQQSKGLTFGHTESSPKRCLD